MITDMCLPDALKPAEISEIVRVAEEAEPKLALLVREVVREVGMTRIA